MKRLIAVTLAAVTTIGLLSGCTQHDGLCHAVGHEIQMSENVEREILLIGVDLRLDKYIDAVLSAHFDVAELFAAASVDIQEELCAFRRIAHIDMFDVQLLFVWIVDKKAACAGVLVRENGVETHRVGREFQQVTAACRESVFDARTRCKSHQSAYDKE